MPAVARSASSARRADHVQMAAVARVERQRQAEVARGRCSSRRGCAASRPSACRSSRASTRRWRSPSSSRSRTGSAAMNQSSVRRKTSGVSQRQQNGIGVGDLAGRDEHVALVQVADDLVFRLDGGVAVQPAVLESKKRPASSIGASTARPCVFDSSKSSPPQPGAMWTMPVPSSIETSSQATTRCSTSARGGQVGRTGRGSASPTSSSPGSSSTTCARPEALRPRPSRRCRAPAVLGVRVDRGRHVRRQRPRRRRPDDERLAVPLRSVSGKRT